MNAFYAKFTIALEQIVIGNDNLCDLAPQAIFNKVKDDECTCILPLDKLALFLRQLKQINELVKIFAAKTNSPTH